MSKYFLYEEVVVGQFQHYRNEHDTVLCDGTVTCLFETSVSLGSITCPECHYHERFWSSPRYKRSAFSPMVERRFPRSYQDFDMLLKILFLYDSYE
jgi:hypothetical protein